MLMLVPRERPGLNLQVKQDLPLLVFHSYQSF